MNTIIISGRLGNDPIGRAAKNGNQYFTFSVAVNKRGKEKEQDVTTWFNCVTFRHDLAAQLSKGSFVVAVGEMTNRKYEDKDGLKRESWQLVVSTMGSSVPMFQREENTNSDGNPDDQIPF